MSDFATLQRQFMDSIRAIDTPNPPAGVEARRLKVYRELMFNNVAGFIDSGFPVLKSLTDDDVWQQRQRHFFAEHDCTSPLFVDIAASYLEYLQQLDGMPPWEVELAHYEHLELKVDTLPEVTDQPMFNSPQQLLESPLSLYQAAELGCYQYPVHQIGPDNPSPEPQPSFLLVYRDIDDDVAFMALNQVSAQLYDYLKQHPASSAEQVVAAMVERLPQIDANAVAQGAGQLLVQWSELAIIRNAGVR